MKLVSYNISSGFPSADVSGSAQICMTSQGHSSGTAQQILVPEASRPIESMDSLRIRVTLDVIQSEKSGDGTFPSEIIVGGPVSDHEVTQGISTGI